MSLTELAIKRPSFIVVIFAVLTLLGSISYSLLSYELIPKLDVPVITVITVYPGANPTEVEASVTKDMEDAISSVENIKRVYGNSYENLSVVMIELNSGTNVNDGLESIKRKVDEVSGNLPVSARQPTVSKVQFTELPVLRYGFTADMSINDAYEFFNDELKPQISSIEGVAQIDVFGGQEKIVLVDIDKQKLNAYHIPLPLVNSVIQYNGLDFPSGKVESSETQTRIRLSAKYDALSDLQNLPLMVLPTGGKVTLGEVAEVSVGYKDPVNINRVNGLPSLAIGIRKQGDANAVDVAKEVKLKIAQLEKLYADKGLKFTLAIDTTEFTMNAAHAVQFDLQLALILVALVILLFLHSLRDSFIVMLAIPASFISTFIAMYLFGFTLNLITMLGLTLVVGILVDDSIVVLENIHRHLHMGKDRRTAALDGRNEIGFTALSITLVDVVVFLPLAIVDGGVITAIFRQFSVVIVVSTLLSLFVSFTITPLLASRMSKVVDFNKKDPWTRLHAWIEKQISAMTQAYEDALHWGLTHKRYVLGGTILAFVGVMMIMANGFVGSEFVNQGDRGETIINLEMDKSTPISKTDSITKEAEKILLAMPEVTKVLTNVGGSSSIVSWEASGFKTELTVSLVSLKERKGMTTNAFNFKAKEALKKLAGVKVTAAAIGIMGAADDPPIQALVTSDNMDTVWKYAALIKQEMMNTPNMVDVKLTNEGGVPEIKVEPDYVRMKELGLDDGMLGMTLQTAFAGNTDAKYRMNNKDYDIQVRLNDFNRRSGEDVRDLPMINKKGSVITVKEVANVYTGISASRLERTNRVSSIRIDAQVFGRSPGEVSADIAGRINKLNIPPYVQIKYIGQIERQSEGFETLGLSFLVSIILVYLVLVALYDNYIYPFVALAAIPVALIGAFLALALAQQNLSIFTMLGLIVMSGLVTKNSILIVDFANDSKEKGMNSFDALIEAGKERLRPILMTTLAMILGMLPVALSKGAGAEWKSGLGWVLIGGLTSSMLLTLFVVPAFYLIVDRMLGRYKPEPKSRPGESE